MKLSMLMPKNDLLLFSSLNPVLYGIYTQGRLIESFQCEDKTLNALIKVQEAIAAYGVKRVFYANGPGSFTAIKLTHIFLQTLHIVEGIELFCVDSFFFNSNAPIKAFGNRYFQKKQGQIVLESFEKQPESVFALPKILNEEAFGSHCEPLYVLPAV